MNINKQRVFSNFIWRFLERFGAQGVTLIVSIVLARLLDPKVYGTVALITVITTILQVFVDSGLGVALIQKIDADSLDFSTVFYFNLFICVLLYCGLFLSAPSIAAFYDMSNLVAPIRVLGLLLIISGFKNIQGAYVSRHLLFKKYFFATLGGTISAAVVGILVAYLGGGVWALIMQNLINQTIDTIILWILVKWRPTKEFSIFRLKSLLSYSWKLLVSSLFDTGWNQLRQLIVGKVYSTNDLAFYNKGNEYPLYATTALTGSIDSVLLPVLSANQTDPMRVKELTRISIKVSSYIVFPMMAGLIGCSRQFVFVVLTDKCFPVIPYFITFCIVYAFYPMQTANLSAIKAMGRSDLFLKLELVKKAVDFCIILITIKLGVLWLAFGMVIACFFSLVINSWPNKNLLNYRFLEQLRDIFPNVIISTIMGGLVYCISLIGLSDFLTLCIQIPFGIIVYLGISIFFKINSYIYIKDILTSYIKKGADKTCQIF